MPYQAFSFSTRGSIRTMTARTTAQLSPPMTAARLPLPMTATRLIPPTTAARLPLPHRQRRGGNIRRGGQVLHERRKPSKAKYICKATLKPHVAKTNANNAIAKSLTNTHEDNTAAVKIRQDDMRKLISLFYLQIGAPPPKDWYGNCGMILRVSQMRTSCSPKNCIGQTWW